jgi:hypothetical protein
VDSAHALGEAIARFKVDAAAGPDAAGDLLVRLSHKRDELARALERLVRTSDDAGARAAAEDVLASLGEAMAEARARLHRGGQS